MKRKVWLIRHGESIANAGAATENHKNIPLSPKGHRQAQEINLLIPYPPTLIITSPFTRARETAAPTLKRFPQTPQEVWSVEEFTYLSPASCINTTAADRRSRVDEYWERLDPDFIDGEDAESFRQFICRAKDANNRLERIEEGFIVMFTHAQFIRAMRAIVSFKDLDIYEIMKRFRELPRIENCEVIEWAGRIVI